MWSSDGMVAVEASFALFSASSFSDCHAADPSCVGDLNGCHSVMLVGEIFSEVAPWLVFAVFSKDGEYARLSVERSDF